MGLTTIKTYGNKMLFAEGPIAVGTVPKWLGYLIKESMLYGTNDIKGGPGSWSVAGSGDSVAAGMDAVDRWTDYTKVTCAPGNHSWIVMKQTALGAAPGYLQVCIDFNSVATTTAVIVFSMSAGFTGGSISARPTATDEVVVATTLTLTGVASNSSCGVNCLKSSDGKVTRMINSVDGNMTSNRQYWFMEQLNNVESYWTNDVVVGACIPTIAGMASASNIYTRQGSTSHSGRMTSEGNVIYQLSNAALVPAGLLTPDYEGKWLAYPCGYLIDTGLNKGRLGAFFDLWTVSARMGNYEYLAAEGGGDFKFVNVGGIVLPWVGTPLMVP